jgi:hypothetical protein
MNNKRQMAWHAMFETHHILYILGISFESQFSVIAGWTRELL